jgi:hypothetical protein
MMRVVKQSILKGSAVVSRLETHFFVLLVCSFFLLISAERCSYEAADVLSLTAVLPPMRVCERCGRYAYAGVA